MTLAELFQNWPNFFDLLALATLLTEEASSGGNGAKFIEIKVSACQDNNDDILLHQ
jgi:hypothetical protein